MPTLHIGLIGDRNDAEVPAHRAIPIALRLAAGDDARIEVTWLPTEMPDKRLPSFDGLWCVPNSPYVSTQGALEAIRYARENAVPYLGTCGGFQHALLEYARNVIGLAEADHAEMNPAAALPMLARLSCPLVEVEERIFLQENSRLRQIYGRAEATEPYHCNYGPHPAHIARLDDGRLRVAARDAAGEVRAVELAAGVHPFFVACLFQFERSALRGQGHPIVRAYVEAILAA